ncbi:thioredoxin family protein [Micromonospora sp. MS34]|uniref:DF family (seleno)protein n=1 Tax=Micromonospora sp. MS34 TaxID=3385971 RepID=UPI00399F4A3D
MIEVLYFDGCPNHEGLEEHLRSLLAVAGFDTPITSRRIDSDEQAQREHFVGSPTIRINGVDVDPTLSGREDYGLMCRVYQTEHGLRGTPPDAWILDALRHHE